MKEYGKWGPAKAALIFEALPPCQCGCCRPARFEFKIGPDVVELDDPAVIQALIEEMTAGFKILFPETAP